MVQTYDIGDLVTLEGLFEAETVLGDPTTLIPTDPTTITLRVRDPGGTTTVYVYGSPSNEMTNDEVGRYRVEIVPLTSGLWHYRWEGTGTAQAAEDQRFIVRRSRVLAG